MNRLYSRGHIWVRLIAEREALLGVTSHLVRSQKKPACINLCEPGDALRVGEWMGDIEFHKGVFELRCPVDGVVLDVNEAILLDPHALQRDPEQWLVRMTNVSTPRALLDTAAYLRYIRTERNET